MKPIERVKKIIEDKRLSISAFEKEVGMSNNSIQTAIKRNSNLKDETLNSILNTYPEISAEWLLTGKGSMNSPNQNQGHHDSETFSDNWLKESAIRIAEIYQYYGLGIQEFAKKIEVDYSTLMQNVADKLEINDSLYIKIYEKFPEVNPWWLLTGKGEMLKQEKEVPITDGKRSGQGIPLLPFSAFAGLGDTGVSGVPFDAIEERYEVPLFKNIKVDFMLPVRGSSMYPKYSSGDVVACMLVKELLFIQWNKVYVVDTKSQGTIMKRLLKSKEDDCVICRSDNKDYPDFKVPLQDVRNIALVVGVIRLE